MSNKKHSICSPSSSYRWIHCPASAVLESKLAIDSVSSESIDGTLMHEYAESKLNGTSFDKEISEEFIELSTFYVEFCNNLHCDKVYVEEEIYLEYDPENSGRADFIGIKGNELYVCDLKTGYSQVDAYRNSQLSIYAYSFAKMNQLKFNKVHLCIVMPRLERVFTWDIDFQTLEKFYREISSMAYVVMEMNKEKSDLECYPSYNVCKYCKAKGICKAHNSYTFSSFSDSVMNENELLEAFERIPNLKSWIEGIEARAFECAKDNKLSGYKLVEGKKGIRKWDNEEDACKKLSSVLGDTSWVKTLISPTVAEKLLKKEHKDVWESLQDDISQSSGKPIIVSESDKREKFKF